MTATDFDDPGADVETRATRVAEASARWGDELANLGGRDPLYSFRDLKVGTLDLAAAEPTWRQRLLDGEETLLSKLFPHEPLRSTALRSTRAIRDKSRELAEERGVVSCYLAVGIATWADPFAAHRPTVPVLLRAARVVARDPAETDFVLTVAEDPLVNPVLLDALDTQLGLRFSSDDLRDPAGLLRYPSVVERLREFAPPHVVEGFSIAHRAVLATFATEPLLLAKDVSAFGVDLEQHDVVAALAGVPEARAAVRTGRHITRPEFLAFDTDPDQEGVVGAVAAGGHLLVDGPPGSGRTQAVATAVAELIGRGRRVLVVGPKRATLADLVARLHTAGLGDAVLDIGACSPAEAVDHVVDAAQRIGAGSAERPRSGDDDPRRTAAALGERLDDYLDALHRPREPWGSSAYQAMVTVASTPVQARTDVRISADALHRGASADTVHAWLREYAELDGFTLTEASSPWFGTCATVEADADDLFAAVVGLRDSAAPALRDSATRAAVEVGLAGPTTLGECLEVVDLLAGVASSADVFGDGIWGEPLDDFVYATADRATRAAMGTSSTMATTGAPGWLTRRQLRRRLHELTAGARLDRAAMHEQLRAAGEHLRNWHERSRGTRTPRTGPHLPDALDAATAVANRLAVLAEANPRAADLAELSFAEVRRRLDGLVADERHLRALPRLRELEADFTDAGLDQLVTALRGRTMTTAEVAAVLEYVRQASALEQWKASDPALRDFDVDRHEQMIDAFRAADAAVAGAAVAGVQAARSDRFAEVAEAFEGQAAVLNGWVDRDRPRTVRDLVQAAPDLALAAVPCWVMSPLAVARELPSRRLFDVVVVEDAGRVTVAQAVPAIARGVRTVLVTDDEVAMTAFTTAVEPAPDPDEHEGPWGGALPPSVVDVLREVLPTRGLTGQYRVRDDRLVGFAAGGSYAGRMRPLPSVRGDDRVRLELVDTVDESGGDTRNDPVDSSSAEVTRVVELVLEHMRTRPHESLGVVTLGPRHAERVDTALRRALVRAPDVAGHLHEDRAEPFFVKDVERVGGDVRDAIVLSLGYGRSVDGRILYRFGALGRPGGERRLATATTRARTRMTVVSTFAADDLSPRRLSTPGAQALGEFLAYLDREQSMAERADTERADPERADPAQAASQRSPHEQPGASGHDPLAESVARKLRAAGASVVLGLGGRSGIPLAVRHPTRRDRFVLAIDTDGHTYAARGEARLRDRLWRIQLGRLGWAVHRVWSAAWAADPDAETERLLAAYAVAVADADAYDWAVAAAEADIVAGMPDDHDDAITRKTSGDGSGHKPPGDDMGDDAAEGVAGGDAAGPDAGAQRVGPRPLLPRGRLIGDHTGRELAALARWLESDDRSRSEDEVVALAADDLGLAVDERVGEVLRHAVRVARAGAPSL